MKWDQNNPEKVKDFIAKMKQDYAFKKAYAARRAWEFYNHPDVAGMCYVAVGGLDSITLFLFLRSIGIECRAHRFQCWRIAAYKKFTRRWGSVPCALRTGQRIARTQKLRLSENTGSLFFQKKLPGKSAYCSTRQRKTRLCATQL